MFIKVICLAALATGLVEAADVNANYLHPKAYAEYPPRSGSSEFNTSGRPVRYELSGGTVRVVFEDLKKFAIRPHVQVSTRALSSTAQQTCGAVLEPSGDDLVAVVSCMSANRSSTPEITVLIVDETTDAAYMTLSRCEGVSDPYSGCGVQHSRWSSAIYPMRVVDMSNGRWHVFLKLDDPKAFWYSSPVALVTPVSSQVACEIFSVGSKHQREDEFGIEVDCRATGGQSVGGTAPRPAINMGFHLLVIPRSARTGYLMSDPSGKAMFATNNWGQLQLTKLSTGRYRVTFKSLAYDWPDNGIVLVESHGTGLEGCSLVDVQRIPSHDVQIDVSCRKVNGDLIDSAFSVVGTSRH